MNRMSEPEVATKAPENDVDETQRSMISNQDSIAQTGASMGDHCTSDRPLPSGQRPSGELTKFGDTGIDVYVSKPADYPNSPGKLLLLLTNGAGVHSMNNQIQADMFAKDGYLVVMPDQFSGDPAPNSKTEEESDSSWLEQIKMRAAETAKSFLIDMWLARHTSEKVLPILHKVLEVAKDEYADAVANGDGIYAVGYCFGAKYVIILAGEHPDTVLQGQAAKDEEQGVAAKGPLIKAGSLAHATLVTREDLSAVKAPISMACVENDPLFPNDILEHGRKSLASSSVEHEIKMYPGVPHGFAVVGEYESSSIQEAQSTAFDQMLSWLNRH